MAANFDLAPPTKTVDGLLAVPIDVSAIDASFVFDGAASTASADATITYTVGPTAGNPIFDLRQTIGEAWLDGAPFPVAKLAHHGFGTGSFTDLRVIESVQPAGSVHTLRVLYPLAIPNSQLGGSYLPALSWAPGPKLTFVFGLSDLNRARYVEAWLPANLIFDQFAIDLEIQILNTLAAHAVITNGSLTSLGTNHWTIAYTGRFSAVSPLLEVRSADTLQSATSTVGLPVSGKTVTIEAWKPAGASTDLTTQINSIKSLLIDNENDYGGYLHGNRYVAFFNGGGMEYEGGATTSSGALLHETFHSWFARGIKPASQADGWWDEGFTSWHDAGANDAIPFDFTQPPVLLCSRDPWQRHTPGNAYGDGSALFSGLASMIGVAQLNTLMGDLYDEQKGLDPVSTARIEEFLVSRSGNTQVVSAFHRFAFGLADPSPAPDLWLKDDPADPGANDWPGAFWDSPDVWIRNKDDGGTMHQSPESGQDNWFYARVRNRGSGTATHFVVTFHSRGFAGTEFLYPGDFLPSIAATAGFDLASGDTRIVKSRWPRALVPPAGTHTCLLAAVHARPDMPAAGKHVWEHNNLAQKNLIVVDLLPDTFEIIPVVIGNWSGARWSGFDLEVLDDSGRALPRRGLDVSLIHASRAFFGGAKDAVHPLRVDVDRIGAGGGSRPNRLELLDCGGRMPSAEDGPGALLTSDHPELIAARFPDSWEAPLPDAEAGARWRVDVKPISQTVVGLKVASPARTTPGQSVRLHFVQRRRGTRQIVGGVAVQVNIRKRGRAIVPNAGGRHA
jgi:hypothetical protein